MVSQVTELNQETQVLETSENPAAAGAVATVQDGEPGAVPGISISDSDTPVISPLPEVSLGAPDVVYPDGTNPIPQGIPASDTPDITINTEPMEVKPSKKWIIQEVTVVVGTPLEIIESSSAKKEDLGVTPVGPVDLKVGGSQTFTIPDEQIAMRLGKPSDNTMLNLNAEEKSVTALSEGSAKVIFSLQRDGLEWVEQEVQVNILGDIELRMGGIRPESITTTPNQEITITYSEEITQQPLVTLESDDGLTAQINISNEQTTITADTQGTGTLKFKFQLEDEKQVDIELPITVNAQGED